jgi:hypothetical protein
LHVRTRALWIQCRHLQGVDVGTWTYLHTIGIIIQIRMY